MLQIGIQKKNSAVKFEKNCQIVTIELLQTNQNSLTTIILNFKEETWPIIQKKNSAVELTKKSSNCH